VSGAITCGIINLLSDYVQISSESASSQIKPLEEKQVNKVRDGLVLNVCHCVLRS
jgi:hypothetical protein